MTNPINRSGSRRQWLAGLVGLLALPARAIDNPDAPDRVAAFAARCRPFEARFEEGARTTADIGAAYAAYERFLDHELNRAYADLRARLDGAARDALARSQRRWLQYRDAEFAFIARNWTRRNFGSSAAVSGAGYRSALVKARVLALLQYLQNYGP